MHHQPTLTNNWVNITHLSSLISVNRTVRREFLWANSTFHAAQDDREAIDKSNIIDERTRGAKPRATYQEPGDNVAGLE